MELQDFRVAEQLWYSKDILSSFGKGGRINTVIHEDGVAYNCRGEDLFEFQPDLAPEHASITTSIMDDYHAHVVFDYKNKGLVLTEKFEFYKDINANRQVNTVKNVSNDAFTFSHISSTRINILASGNKKWDNPERFKIYYCNQGWATEGQWKCSTFRDFGMADARDGWTRSTIKFSSKGNWTTADMYPLVIIEDTENNCAYYLENESGGTWEIQIGKMDNYIYIDSNNCNIENDGWCLKLNPGESFTTRPAVFGKVDGSFEDAVRELTQYKRYTSKHSWKNGIPLVCYNDYMLGTLGNPTADIYEMITAAGNAGCEVFCIDANWYKPPKSNDKNSAGERLGDYIANDLRFAPYTFKDMINHIKECGMIPGVWFEFESVTNDTEGYYKENFLLQRNGKPLGGKRGFYDLTNHDVREYLLESIRRAYSVGVRYIKNDYNQNIGIGPDGSSGNYSIEGMKQVNAFFDFIDDIYLEFPDMIIENCGSGAMRSDNATLSNFFLQSTSDQSVFFNYPSIVQGSLSQMPPEKAGIWSFTVPVRGEEPTPEAIKRSAEKLTDGETVTFNLVTAMLGCMYFSGWLNYADQKNTALVHEAIKTYKSYRNILHNSHAVYPNGFIALGESGFSSLGIISEADNRFLLAVWKINTDDEDFTIDLSKYNVSASCCKQIFPREDSTCSYSFENGKLKVHMPQKAYMARLFDFS